jgi:hypothetical protein
MAGSARLLDGVVLRLAACGIGGAVVIVGMMLVYPACLNDPQAGIDPLLRELWLDHVEEARPLVSVVLAAPVKFMTFALAALLGLAATLAAAWREQGAARVNWLVVAAFAAMGLVTSLWQIRGLSSASAVAVFGGAWIVAKATDRVRASSSPLAKLAPIALLLPFCSLFWMILAPTQAKSSLVVGREVCRSPAATRSLDALPKSVLMAPIDMGPDILADTGHLVLAAPYHRNNHGNREMVDVMLAKPDEARKIFIDSGAEYIVFCPAMPEAEIYAAASPDGLAAALLANKPPDWLAAEPIAGSPYRIHKVR